MPPISLSPAWRRALPALLALWAFTLWQYRETALAMAAIWNRSETFTHAWVVPPIVFWLVWRLRGQVLALTPRPAPLALALMAALGLLWLSGEVVAVATATQFALVGLLVLAVPALLGWPVARALAFPLGFAFFCVPFGEFMSPTLMDWTANFTVAALRATGIPVYQEGLQFVIPSGRWSVVEACSGIRYLIASVMVGTLFAYLNYDGRRKRLIFVGVSILVPLVANWLRAYMIVMLGHLSNNEIAVGADHLLYGWVFFGIVIVALYWIGARWADALPETPAFAPATGHWPALAGGAVAALAAAVTLAPLLAWQHIQVALQLKAELPSPWQGAADPAPHWQPAFASPSASQRLAYQGRDGPVVGVHLAYYRSQDKERKLISSTNRLVDGEADHWQQLSMRAHQVALPDGPLGLREAVVWQTERPGRSRLRLRVWQLYWVDGQWMGGDIAGKLRGAWGRLAGRGDDAALLLLYADDSDGRAEAALGAFMAQALPSLTQGLAAVRSASTAP
jgi:exosortase A